MVSSLLSKAIALRPVLAKKREGQQQQKKPQANRDVPAFVPIQAKTFISEYNYQEMLEKLLISGMIT